MTVINLHEPGYFEVWATDKPLKPKHVFKTWDEAVAWSQALSRKSGKRAHLYMIAAKGTHLTEGKKL